MNCIQWSYKYAQTTGLGVQQQQLTVNCFNKDQIWIGWSHYGTRIMQSTADSTHMYKQAEQVNTKNDFSSINMYVNPFHHPLLLIILFPSLIKSDKIDLYIIFSGVDI